MANVLVAELDRLRANTRAVVLHARDVGSSLFRELAGLPMVHKFRSAENPKRMFMMCAVSLIVAFGAAAFASTMPAPEFDCRARVIADPQVQVAAGPLSLLSMAQQDASSEGSKRILKQCVDWVEAANVQPSLAELHAQLQCHNVLLTMPTDSASPESCALAERLSAKVLGLVRDTNAQCEVLRSKFRAALGRGPLTKPVEMIVALGGVSGFEVHAQEAVSALKLVTEILETRMATGDWIAADLMQHVPNIRIRLRGCLLDVGRAAHTIAVQLPTSSPAAQRTKQCRPNFLHSFARLALSESQLELEPAIAFDSGAWVSEVVLATASVPFFGDAQPDLFDLVLDVEGTHAPQGFVRAEEQMDRALNLSFGSEREERGIRHAARICQHAKYMMEKKRYRAAEWRYRYGAALATKHGREKLASHALASLSYMFSMLGKQEMALQEADEAMRLAPDHLASYLQVAMRLSLGELRTDAQTRYATEQLLAARGKLPGFFLEEQRASMHKHLVSWLDISESDSLHACLKSYDVAHIVICLVGTFAYAV